MELTLSWIFWWRKGYFLYIDQGGAIRRQKGIDESIKALRPLIVTPGGLSQPGGPASVPICFDDE